jgi:hypothetical protein
MKGGLKEFPWMRDAMKTSSSDIVLGGRVETGIPSRYLKEPFQKLLGVIMKYFTVKGGST